MTHLLQLTMYTALVVVGTLLARQTWWLAGAYRVSQSMKDATLHHVCDNPDECPAGLMVVEFQTSHRQIAVELMTCVLGLVVTAAAFAYGFTLLAQR